VITASATLPIFPCASVLLAYVLVYYRQRPEYKQTTQQQANDIKERGSIAKGDFVPLEVCREHRRDLSLDVVICPWTFLDGREVASRP
jgi:hypothetical protein